MKQREFWDRCKSVKKYLMLWIGYGQVWKVHAQARCGGIWWSAIPVTWELKLLPVDFVLTYIEECEQSFVSTSGCYLINPPYLFFPLSGLLEFNLGHLRGFLLSVSTLEMCWLCSRELHVHLLWGQCGCTSFSLYHCYLRQHRMPGGPTRDSPRNKK